MRFPIGTQHLGADRQVAPSSLHSEISTRWQHMLGCGKMADVLSIEGDYDYPVSDYNIFSFLDDIIEHTLKFLPMKSLHTCAR